MIFKRKVYDKLLEWILDFTKENQLYMTMLV